MGRDEKKRQKSLMKKRSKDASRKKKANSLIARGIGHFSAEGRVLGAEEYPIYECLINPFWKEEGLARILLSRKQPDGAFVFGVYMVDILCLGLKITFCNANFSSPKYDELKAGIFQDTDPVICPVPLARRIVYGAIEYASKLGFKPQGDFERSKHVLGEEDESTLGPGTEVEFGKDGKPFFIAGPDDEAELVIKKLEAKLGSGNYDFVTSLEQSV